MRSVMKAVVAVAAAALAVGCGASADGPPHIEVDRTSCSHCSMLISEPRYAAAYQPAQGDARVFDDVGCLLDAARQEAGAPRRFWFNDAADGTWINGPDATFVLAADIRTPMSGGVVAYRTRAAADEAASRHRGEVVVSIADLLKRTEGGS
ncbi:MAG TPA: nitrous oxide reductase accessory protein NosL [Vicinamibacterales bacterium]|nr:nitrous oxide reductase accessory protein NosL [Vicinamibacterales bacterium]